MTLQTTRSGANAHPEEMLDFLLSHVIEQSGVKELGNNNLEVVEQDPVAMAVDVNQGYAYIKNSAGSKVYPVRIYSADEAVSISGNASGNTRIDAIVLYINLGASPNSGATNVATLTVVEGTPSASPSAPSDNDIQTAIGASNPFIRLADITVANGETEITDSEITDQRTRATYVKRSGDWTENVDGATITFDVEEYRNYVVLGGNRILAVENDQSGDEFLIKLIQDGTGGRTVTWWSNIDWDGGSEPTLSTDPDVADVFGFHKKADGRYEGYIVGLGMTIA